MFQVSSPSEICEIYPQDLIDMDTGLNKTRFAPRGDPHAQIAVLWDYQPIRSIMVAYRLEAGSGGVEPQMSRKR